MFKLVISGLFLLLTAPAFAMEDWPNRPITLVVGFSAGGNTDMAGRIFAASMNSALPVSVVVENRPGAGGTLGASFVGHATPDGHTLLIGSQSETTMLKANRAKPPYDIERAFTPIAKLMDQDYVLVVPNSLNISSWPEFVQYAKANGEISYATPGIGTTAHIMSAHLLTALGIQGTHIPYQGAAAIRTDLLAGRIDFAIDVIPLSLPFIKDGRLRAIAVTQQSRNQLLPNAVSLVELGVFEESYAGWTGVFAPKGISSEVREEILANVNQMLKGPGGEEIRKNGYRPASGEQRLNDFQEFVASDQQRWISTFQKLGLEPVR